MPRLVTVATVIYPLVQFLNIIHLVLVKIVNFFDLNLQQAFMQLVKNKKSFVFSRLLPSISLWVENFLFTW